MLWGQAHSDLLTPESHFGFIPGTDRMLFDYESLVGYLKTLDTQSPRLKLLPIGKTPMGKTMYSAFISSPENIENLDALKEINRRLALDPGIPPKDLERMVAGGKVFFVGALSMHSTEVGPSQAAPVVAYQLCSTQDPEELAWLDNVVYMMVPSHNPDGMDMVVGHYKKYKGTKYEGSSMPGVYHKYVGHDNNRDFVSLTQEDTRAISDLTSKEWFPQILAEKHQMGSSGVRYFVPPYHDPIAENVDAEVWNWGGLLGTNMLKDMTEQGLAGVSQHYLFDDYWPSSTETCVWKNVIGILTECASVQVAKPIYIEPNELRVGGKGLSEYKKSVNMPEPWPGGWWRLGDLVEYERVSTLSIIKTASRYREEILRFRNRMCRKEVEKGRTLAPYYYIMPLDQRDRGELAELVNLLDRHGVDVYQLTAPVTVGREMFKAGDVVVPLAQPFRAFIKEVMELQEFPLRHYTPGGKIIKPYDITSWSLPLHRGVASIEVNVPVKGMDTSLKKVQLPFALKDKPPANYTAALFTVDHNESFKAVFQALGKGLSVRRLVEPFAHGTGDIPAGSFVIRRDSKNVLDGIIRDLHVTPLFLANGDGLKTKPVQMPRIALVETYFHDMDAGWTRYLFDTSGITYTVVRPQDFAKTDFARGFDVVIFPSADKHILMSGKRKRGDDYYPSYYPPKYQKGIGEAGMKRLMTFLDGGGIILSWGASTNLFMDTLTIPKKKGEPEVFRLPVKNLGPDLKKAGLYCPGSMVKIKLTANHPLTYGLPGEIGVFSRGRPVFRTSQPYFDMDRRVIGVFPEKDILISGFCEKEKKLGRHAAMVWVKKGAGQVVLYGFQPQFRASTPASYKLLFNGLLLERLK
jgi:hypothetical protein